MKSVLAFFRNCINNPKTTATGIALVASGVGVLVNDPSSVALLSPGNPVLLILTGAGFLFGADQSAPAEGPKP